MASLRLVLPASALLVFALCWSANANPTEETPLTGVVTKYFTPIANLSLDKLVGRWYVAGFGTIELPPNITRHICLQLDFRRDDNGTLVAEPMSLLDGNRLSPVYTFPVSDIGLWDAIYAGVAGDAVLSRSHMVVHVDDRFLAVGTCKNTSVKDCAAYVLVRHLADGDRHSEVEDLYRQVASEGAGGLAGTFLWIIEHCRSFSTAAPDLSAQSGPSTPGTE